VRLLPAAPPAGPAIGAGAAPSEPMTPCRDPGAAQPGGVGAGRRVRRALLLTTAPGVTLTRYPAWVGRRTVAVGACPLDAGPAALAATLDAQPVDLLVVLLSEHAPPCVRDSILALHTWGRPVWIVPARPGADGAAPAAERFAPPLGPGAAAAKRALDVALALGALAVAAPVMAAIALVVRRDSPGPAIFRQRRIGRHARPFYMYKFRTMYHQTEQAEAGLHGPTPAPPPGPGAEFKLPDDPRITRAGRFLRRSSLDELPQLFNVLRGEMSLVGPRPELPAVAALCPAWGLARLAVPPGMTGWWQVCGRSNRPLAVMMEDDLYYLRRYSLALDLRILARTVRAVISGAGAY
jgi:lipopolysaccharide/colanic/teichoic acid biosynthesis glycosyltransferase